MGFTGFAYIVRSPGNPGDVIRPLEPLVREPGNLLKNKSLDDEWCDKDIVMLHACFLLLEDCVEQEKLLDGTTEWEQN